MYIYCKNWIKLGSHKKGPGCSSPNQPLISFQWKSPQGVPYKLISEHHMNTCLNHVVIECYNLYRYNYKRSICWYLSYSLHIWNYIGRIIFSIQHVFLFLNRRFGIISINQPMDFLGASLATTLWCHQLHGWLENPRTQWRFRLLGKSAINFIHGPCSSHYLFGFLSYPQWPLFGHHMDEHCPFILSCITVKNPS